ncbi:Na+/melibiose symporter-like transporter [Compostimonas suwonensis]|uniref:Na+/melibiose symporter-like transporter n=2 Tax=Compostimonas suwonensis TaxID=1048394 RepID=A0A2M9BW63_9MICO|nr:Na+/melibiose symporter-like transporter [Compostimonas suwonensis]
MWTVRAIEARGWGLLVGLAVVSVALFALYSGVLSVLLPAQLAEIDPEGKVAALAVVTSVSFAVTALAQPVFGALSDRTRTRWGRRVPWMLAGAVVGGATVGAMGGAETVAALTVLWAVGQFSLNGLDIASSVYLVDAFPARRRGSVAGVLGMSAIVGGAIGVVAVGRFSAEPAAGYWLLAAAVIVAVVLFAVILREPEGREPSGAREREPFRLRVFLGGFLVDPRRHPDFLWVLLWRLGFAIAYGSVYGYLLYVLTDYVGVGPAEAAELVGRATVVGGAGVVVAVLAGGWLSDRLGRRKPFILVACALVVGANVIPLVMPTTEGILVLAACMGAAMGLAIACGTALASQVLPAPDEHAARGLGIVNFATNVGQAIAPLVAASVIAVSGYPALFVVSAAVMLVSAAAILPVKESGRAAATDAVALSGRSGSQQ